MKVPAPWAAIAALLLSIPAHAASVKASSELTDDDGNRLRATLAFDGQLQTAWSEGEMGPGEGSWISLAFDRATEVESISIWPGDLSKGERSLRENGRPHTVTVHLLGTAEPVTAEVRILDGAEKGIQRIDVPVVGKATGVKLVVDQAYPGGLRNDMHIAEVAVNFVGGAAPASVAKVAAWAESSSGLKAAEAHQEQVIALFEQFSDAEFGDRDALKQLMDWAGDGAPWLRARVQRDVPYGWRSNALPPDPVAIEALLKLRDPNAIPALELAALRSTGKRAKELRLKAGYFAAYAELESGGRRNVPVWGDTGWERGALRGFGEPLAVGLGAYGDIYVADTGNHRVQVLGQGGATKAIWGAEGEAAVANEWFGGRRAFYVAGNAPGESKGGFVNPVDLVVVPQKEGEHVAVLDASGRVQVFTDGGERIAGWRLETDGPISAGVGGEGHLAYAKGQYVSVWGNVAHVHDEEGTLQNTFDIEEGVPTWALGLKSGKVLFGFRGEAVLYNLDGFRHGVQLGPELPRGFEAWDVDVDEKGKLWVVTDNGWALKSKKPGKLELKVRIADDDLAAPRFAVQEGMLWVSFEDRVKTFDVLELVAEAEGAEE